MWLNATFHKVRELGRAVKGTPLFAILNPRSGRCDDTQSWELRLGSVNSIAPFTHIMRARHRDIPARAAQPYLAHCVCGSVLWFVPQIHLEHTVGCFEKTALPFGSNGEQSSTSLRAGKPSLTTDLEPAVKESFGLIRIE